jgi:hypothetical protein
MRILRLPPPLKPPGAACAAGVVPATGFAAVVGAAGGVVGDGAVADGALQAPSKDVSAAAATPLTEATRKWRRLTPDSLEAGSTTRFDLLSDIVTLLSPVRDPT